MYKTLRGVGLPLLSRTVMVGSLQQLAFSEVLRDFQFEANGVLPTIDPEVSYVASNGTPESTAFSVAGGILQQRLFGMHDNSAYVFIGGPNYAGDLDHTFGHVLEVRVAVVRTNGLQGGFFDFADGVRRYFIAFDVNGAYLLSDGGYVLVNSDIYQPHTYQIVSLANSDQVRVIVDGQHRATLTAPATSINGAQLCGGSASLGHSGDLDWYYWRLSRVDPACVGDINGDAIVNLSDLSTLLAHFGALTGTWLQDGDIDGDGSVGLGDLSLLLANFGSNCP